MPPSARVRQIQQNMIGTGGTSSNPFAVSGTDIQQEQMFTRAFQNALKNVFQSNSSNSQNLTGAGYLNGLSQYGVAGAFVRALGMGGGILGNVATYGVADYLRTSSSTGGRAGLSIGGFGLGAAAISGRGGLKTPDYFDYLHSIPNRRYQNLNPTNPMQALRSLFGGWGNIVDIGANVAGIWAGRNIAGPMIGSFSHGPFGSGPTGSIIALTAAFEVLRRVTDQLIAAVGRGSRLFENAAAMGVTTGTASTVLKSLSAIGIDPQQAMRLAAYGQFRPGMNTAEIAGVTVSAGMRVGMSQLEIQQIMNMMPQLSRALHDLGPAMQQTAAASESNFETMYQWRVFKEDFAAFWEQMAAVAGPVLRAAIESVDYVTKGVNRLFKGLDNFIGVDIFGLDKGYALPDIDSSKNNKRLIPELRDTHFSALERIGLVIGGGGHGVSANTKALQQLNVTIQRTNVLLDQQHGTPAWQATYNRP